MKSVDELQTAANLPLIWPTVSPDETRAAARTSIAGRPVPAVLDLRNGELRTFPEHWYIYPYSWTAAGNKILFERENRDRKTWEVGEIDPVTGKLRLLGEGAQPISSRQEGRVAFVSVDLKTISVREGGGATLTFRGFFKRLLAWLDETRILFVSGVGYVDSLGILDTKTSAIETYKLPSHGEISGGCELTSH